MELWGLTFQVCTHSFFGIPGESSGDHCTRLNWCLQRLHRHVGTRCSAPGFSARTLNSWSAKDTDTHELARCVHFPELESGADASWRAWVHTRLGPPPPNGNAYYPCCHCRRCCRRPALGASGSGASRWGPPHRSPQQGRPHPRTRGCRAASGTNAAA